MAHHCMHTLSGFPRKLACRACGPLCRPQYTGELCLMNMQCTCRVWPLTAPSTVEINNGTADNSDRCMCGQLWPTHVTLLWVVHKFDCMISGWNVALGAVLITRSRGSEYCYCYHWRVTMDTLIALEWYILLLTLWFIVYCWDLTMALDGLQ